MNRKTRNVLKFLAIIMVLLAVFMELGHVKFFDLERYRFWIVVMGFGISIITSTR